MCFQEGSRDRTTTSTSGSSFIRSNPGPVILGEPHSGRKPYIIVCVIGRIIRNLYCQIPCQHGTICGFAFLVIGISEVDVLCLEKRISESDLTYTKLEDVNLLALFTLCISSCKNIAGGESAYCILVPSVIIRSPFLHSLNGFISISSQNERHVDSDCLNPVSRTIVTLMQDRETSNINQKAPYVLITY